MGKKIIIISGVIILALLVFALPKKSGEPVSTIQEIAAVIESPHVKIGENIFFVELADTRALQILGLSNHESLKEDHGMLFIFEDKEVRQFWMKNMNFPIDIIWLDDDTVVNISENLPPDGDEPVKTYSSNSPVNYVLEINAGYAKEYEMQIGDKVIFNL